MPGLPGLFLVGIGFEKLINALHTVETAGGIDMQMEGYVHALPKNPLVSPRP